MYVVLVSRATVYSWIKSINTSSTIDLKSPTNRSRIIRTKSLIYNVFPEIEEYLYELLRKEMNVSWTTIPCVIKEDLSSNVR